VGPAPSLTAKTPQDGARPSRTAVMKLQFSKSEALEGFRFNAQDHCRLAILVDPEMSGGSMTWFLEIHDPGDRVPAHTHHHAIEAYFVLRGDVIFHTEDGALLASGGDSVVIPADAVHDFENPGPGRVYLITLLANDGGEFARLLRAGVPTPLDAEDLEVLRHL
jgi:mannose-6-phosphate isomerase-like protein (cupin superfamily)